MNKDIRISVSFYNHIKRRKLEKKLGAKAVLSLIDLWLYAGINKPDGVLTGMDEEDIALAAQWNDDPQKFVQTLVELHLLDKLEGNTYVLHDWTEHNAYAAHAKDRSEIARQAAKTKWSKLSPEEKAEHARKMAKAKWNKEKAGIHADNLQDASSNTCGVQAECLHDACGMLPPSPNPSPSPSPNPNTNNLNTKVVSNDTTRPQAKLVDHTSPESSSFKKEITLNPSNNGKKPHQLKDCPHQEIINLYHEILPELPKVKIWNDIRQKLLRARWREDPQRQNLEWWRKFFEFIRDECPFLTGKLPGRDGRIFQADLEWIIRPTNFVKILEGRYRSHPLEGKVSPTTVHNLQAAAQWIRIRKEKDKKEGK